MLNNYERELLIDAREIIRRKDTRYVCPAIYYAKERALELCHSEGMRQAYIDASFRLRKYIEKSLDYESTLEDWMIVQMEKGVVFPAGSYADSYRKRIQWIDWMLDE